MLAKYINEKKIERYKGYVIIDGTTYANNEEKAREAGFKDLVIEPQPQYDYTIEYLDFYYEDGDVITKKYVIIPIEEE